MGFFGSFFKNTPKLADRNFKNPITTEFHSHLLPAIDDGVRTFDESLMVLEAMAQMGYRKVITTPHIMGDFYKNGFHNIPELCNQLQLKLKEKNIPIELHAAAEYMVDDVFEVKIKNNDLLCFGDKYVLVELPFTEEPANFKQVLFDLQVNGYKPVLAHPERYGYMAQRKSKYEELHQAGIFFQLNLFSILGYYSKEVQKTAEWLISNKMVHLVGSDTHGPRHIEVFRAAVSSQRYQKLCELPLLNNTL
jgi:protein-tyrosine phosphatase